jgi:DNA repair protein RadA
LVTEELELDTLPGVGPVTKQKLMDAGVRNLLDLAIRSPVEVAETVGVEIGKAVDLCNKARSKLMELGVLDRDFVSASDLYQKRLQIERITTGSKNLDDLLGGGVETQAVTEFYGEYGSGKTQLCHTLCVTVQLPREEGGLEAGAIYVDTENTFRPERIVGIAEARNLDPEEVLKRIIVAKAYNSSHQELVVSSLGTHIEKNGARLVIVDSAVAHYRAEFLGRATLAERQQRLNRFMHMLLRLAEAYNVAVVVTNQVQAAPDVFFGDPSRPTGGHVVAHTSTYRVYLRKAGRNRIARMVDSPYHPEREVPFVLNEKGVSDPEEGGRRR